MKCFSVRFLWISAFCAALTFLLTACLESVDPNILLEDDIVQGIINSGLTNMNIDLESIGKDEPILSSDGKILRKGETVTLSLGASSPTSVTITVTNAEIFETITWHYSGKDLHTGHSYTITTSVPPFNSKVNIYQLEVETITFNGGPHSSFFSLNIVD